MAGVYVYWEWQVYTCTGNGRCIRVLGMAGVYVYWEWQVYTCTGNGRCIHVLGMVFVSPSSHKPPHHPKLVSSGRKKSESELDTTEAKTDHPAAAAMEDTTNKPRGPMIIEAQVRIHY